MDDLELIKAFAEIEGVKVYRICGDGSGWRTSSGSLLYNPITDLALNCAARDKYRVAIIYGDRDNFSHVFIGNGDPYLVDDCKDIPRLVIECIVRVNK